MSEKSESQLCKCVHASCRNNNINVFDGQLQTVKMQVAQKQAQWTNFYVQAKKWDDTHILLDDIYTLYTIKP